jgi:acetyl esterase/lipase
MIGDVKRAIAWIKANASRYGVDPDKIVLGGGSAGGHLALLAGYTPGHLELTPEDLRGDDLSVCGVLSYYGFTDLLDLYQRMDMEQKEGLPPVPIGTQVEGAERGRLFGRLDILLGGWPKDAPHMYPLASPTAHVGPGCPPTLLIQGEQDSFVPVDATRAHHAKLVESGVPAMSVVYPWTEHAFDLILPQTSPAAQSALYDVDRFLALLASNHQGQ